MITEFKTAKISAVKSARGKQTSQNCRLFQQNFENKIRPISAAPSRLTGNNGRCYHRTKNCEPETL